MLSGAGVGAAWLAPAKAQWLASSTLPKYRELLRSQMRHKKSSSEEEGGSLFQQAKARVLLRLRERRRAARVDPRRAFSRLRARLADARLSLREIKDEQKQRLRAYYETAVASGGGGSGAAAAGSGVGSLAAVEAAEARAAAAALRPTAAGEGGLAASEAQRAAEVMGSNGVLRHLVLAGVGGACKLFLSAGARTTVEGQERMAAALARAPGRGLITVSNHVGSIDDPLITSSIVPATKLLHPPSVRWTMCASDRCFKSALLAPFFRAAKVLPVERGAGLDQFGMRLAQSRLAAGEWVHIFPEGTRSRDGRMQPVRKGVGWLVASAAAAGGPPPLVLPFVHSGMEQVLPKGRAVPKLGQELRVLVGEPVEVADLLAQAADQGWAEQRLQVAIADRVGQALYQLKAELDGLPLEAVAPAPRAAAVSISEDNLLPLIEDEMDSLAHRWHDRWQRLSLPSLTQRLRARVAARRAALAARLSDEGGLLGALLSGPGGASGTPGGDSFDAIAAATEEGAGIISGWEHAGAAPAPWAAGAAAGGEHAAWDEAAWEAWEAAAAGPEGSAARAARAAPLARLKLRLLRGMRPAAPPALAAAAPAGASSSSSSTAAVAGSSLDFVAASPMDATTALMAGGSGSSKLHGLLSVAAAYSAERAQHMRRLLAAPSGAAHVAAA